VRATDVWKWIERLREVQELRYELIQLEHEMRALQDELTRAMEAN